MYPPLVVEATRRARSLLYTMKCNGFDSTQTNLSEKLIQTVSRGSPYPSLLSAMARLEMLELNLLCFSETLFMPITQCGTGVPCRYAGLTRQVLRLSFASFQSYEAFYREVFDDTHVQAVGRKLPIYHMCTLLDTNFPLLAQPRLIFTSR